ncbi:MAG TPA: TRAP transporter large permease subunit [Anaeromyxobacteraceae bacterium]|nr:TRAP transporter large permease subunit [Anaeromyxobacteraceae bacterium]
MSSSSTDTDAVPSSAPSADAVPPRPGTWLERGAVSILLLAMVALPAGETLSRRLLGRGIPGSAVLVQHLTLWVGFLGALLASAAGKHLALSTAEAIPAGWPRRAARFAGNTVAAVVCALLALAAAILVNQERASARTLTFGVPFWWSELVVPVGAALMALRFAWRAGEGRRAGLARALAFAAIAAVMLLGEAVHATPDDFPLSAFGPLGRAVSALAAFVAAHAGALTASPHPLAWVYGLALLVAFLLGAPVFVAMAGLAMALFFKDGTPIAAVPTETLRLVTNPTLPAIPLLTVAGYVLAEGGAARRLVRAYKGLFGWMPGGIAVMAAFVCALFTTFTGASGVTILALGGLILPALLEEGYPEDFSVGLVTAAGSLGLLFPPSLPVILYGVVAQTPIDHLFIGGLVPGLIMVLLVAAYGILVGVRARAPRQQFQPREAGAALWAAKWDLGLPTLVVLAVGTGFATVVEASALACAYSILVEVLVFREVHPTRDLPAVLAHAATLVGSVVILLGVALGLTSWFVDAEIPAQLVDWMTAHVHSPALFLLVLNVALLVLGSVLEIYSAIVVLAPLVAPLGVAYGIEPVHLGVVFLANLELGFLFPPMGLNLFLSASRFQKPLPYLYRKTLPFLVIMAVGVLLITYLPAITTGVVHLVKP